MQHFPSQTSSLPHSSTPQRDPKQDRQLSLGAVEELAHDLRQPLSVIEALAYYVELTSKDEKLTGQMQRIQAMVMQASSILERGTKATLLTRDSSSF